MSLAYCDKIGVSLFQKCGTRTRTRLVDIVKVAASVGVYVCRALIGMHAYTGCDTVSALAGKGKASALKLLTINRENVLCTCITVSDFIFLRTRVYHVDRRGFSHY